MDFFFLLNFKFWNNQVLLVRSSFYTTTNQADEAILFTSFSHNVFLDLICNSVSYFKLTSLTLILTLRATMSTSPSSTGASQASDHEATPAQSQTELELAPGQEIADSIDPIRRPPRQFRRPGVSELVLHCFMYTTEFAEFLARKNNLSSTTITAPWATYSSQLHHCSKALFTRNFFPRRSMMLAPP